MARSSGKAIHVRVTNLDIGAGFIERCAQLLRGAPKRIARHYVTIGIQEAEGGEAKIRYDGSAAAINLATAMRLHEFGTDAIPMRSWLRAWFDANVDRLAAGMRFAMRDEFEGNANAVSEWAKATADEWRAWIAAGGDFTGLMPSTIAAKTRAGLRSPEIPLVATQQFVDAFRARVDGVGV